MAVLHLAVRRTRQCFLVSDLRLADRGLDAELALQAVDDDLQMELAHTRDDDLAGLLVGLHLEGRVFGHQLLEADPELFLIGLGLRLDGERNDGLRKIHRLEHDRMLLVAERVAGRDALQADRRRDVACVHVLDFLALVRVHFQEAADALAALLGGVVDARPRGQHARIHAEERELTDERVGHDLERQRRKRRLVLGRTLDQHRLRVLRVGLLVRVDPDDRRHVERRRQEVHDGVEQRLHTLVLERRSTDDRHERGSAPSREPNC